MALAQAHEWGRGKLVARDKDKTQSLRTQALSQFEIGCSSGKGAQCAEAARMYGSGIGVTRDDGKQRELLEKGCEAKHLKSCADIGLKLKNDKGAPDPLRAMQLFLRACEGDDSSACQQLAFALQDKKIPDGVDEGLVSRTAASACKRGIRSACPEAP
jgi:TPR repeat protein